MRTSRVVLYVLMLSLATNAFLAPPASRARALTALHDSPFDGFTKVFKDAFANDDEFAPETKAPKSLASDRVVGDWDVVMRLVGMPTRDPSNDLFGPKMRIRDAERGISAQEVVATVRIADGVATVLSASEPIFAKEGEYRAQDGQIKIKLISSGLSRTFTTKGTLQSVYGGEATSRTSSVYQVPAGPIILSGGTELLPSTGECFVRKGKISCVEQTGLFGAVEKTTSVGTFSATNAPLGRDNGAS